MVSALTGIGVVRRAGRHIREGLCGTPPPSSSCNVCRCQVELRRLIAQPMPQRWLRNVAPARGAAAEEEAQEPPPPTHGRAARRRKRREREGRAQGLPYSRADAMSEAHVRAARHATRTPAALPARRATRCTLARPRLLHRPCLNACVRVVQAETSAAELAAHRAAGSVGLLASLPDHELARHQGDRAKGRPPSARQAKTPSGRRSAAVASFETWARRKKGRR
jgi:uncharacterized protein involved in copper resistance